MKLEGVNVTNYKSVINSDWFGRQLDQAGTQCKCRLGIDDLSGYLDERGI